MLSSTVEKQNKQHLLYVSGTIPNQGLGSSIIFYRHLKKFEESNWKISLGVPQKALNNVSLPKSWSVIPIPSRKWWWLPAKHQLPWSMELRMYQWSKQFEHDFKKNKPCIIVTYLCDMYSYLAAFLAKKWRIPLAVIVHDDWELASIKTPYYQYIKSYTKTILTQANIILPVSRKLGNRLNAKDNSKTSILLPIPHENNDNFVKWNDNFQKNPTICYAGSIYPYLEKTLEKLSKALAAVNGKLILVTHYDDSVEKLLEQNSNIAHHPFFANNKDAIKFVRDNCSCFVVAYPLFDVQGTFYWKTSFPSKFVEFSHTGLPILILTPPNTALFEWTQEKDWKNTISTPEEKMLFEQVKKIIDKQSWLEMAQQTRDIASSEFNSLNIHNELEKKLLSLTDKNLIT